MTRKQISKNRFGIGFIDVVGQLDESHAPGRLRSFSAFGPEAGKHSNLAGKPFERVFEGVPGARLFLGNISSCLARGNRFFREPEADNRQQGLDDDLLAALETGQIKQATLDVFHIEPLPVEHQFWDHPAITVTPHVASQIDAVTGGRIIAANLKTFEETGTCADVADAKRGY